MDSLKPHLPRIKNGLHAAQGFFILVAGCLTIAYLVKADFGGSSISFYFALCFLSIPPIVYNSMTLMFARSRNWGNAYAFAALDIVFCILWLSSFAAVAAWNSQDLCTGACGLAKAMVGFGFFIFVLFGLTSAISVYGAIYYRNHGSLPGTRVPNNAAMIDPDRDAFSTAPHDDEYAPIHVVDKDDNDHLGRFEAELGGSDRNPYEPASYGNGYARPHAEDEELEMPIYSGASSVGGYRASTVEPDTDMSYTGGSGSGSRVKYPAAPY